MGSYSGQQRLLFSYNKKRSASYSICADCPDYMKDILVKYHRAEPTKALNDKAV